MTAPEDRVYCDDPMCDGDHVFHGDSCSTVCEGCGTDVDPYEKDQYGTLMCPTCKGEPPC